MSIIFSHDFERKKKEIKVLILGPYNPPSAKLKLVEFRDCMKMNGYQNAKLVEDFLDTLKYDPDPDIHFTLKSRDRIKNWADVLVFVFLCDADNQGVGNELVFTCISVQHRLHYSIELHEQGIHLSTQTKGPIKISRINSNDFCSDRQLCELATGFCTKIVYELLWIP
jgi:hypothetical protein